MDSKNIMKVVPFPVFQAHCDERKFVYAGSPGKFDVYCRLGPERCNNELCPIWNSDKVQPLDDKPVQPLRDINLRLKNGINNSKLNHLYL